MSAQVSLSPTAGVAPSSGRSPKLVVVNLFGAPGRGKSTVRAGLFWLMKTLGMSVEEISEYAKYLTLKNSLWQLKEEQLHVFSHQHHHQLLVERNGYRFAITDSPLHLSAFYGSEHNYPGLQTLIDQAYDRFDNRNFFLTRPQVSKAFETNGRAHDQAASEALEPKMRQYLRERDLPFHEMTIDHLTPWRLLHAVAPEVAVPPYLQLPGWNDASGAP